MAKQLDRELGLLSVISIACGAMISGLLVLPGYAAKITGASAYLAFLLAGILFVPATLSKSEMTTAVPEAGGDYLFIDRSLGPVFSTISGLGMFLTFILKAAFALAGMAAYLFLLLPVSPRYASLFAAVVAVTLVLLNYRGAKKAGQVQTVLVVITAVILSAFLLRGTTQVHTEYFQDFFMEGWRGFFAATAIVFVSYAGVTQVASGAEEVKHPGSNIPVGMLVSLILMILFYTAVVYVTVGTVSVSDLTAPAYKNAPLARVGAAIFGWVGEWIMAGMSVLALTAMANAGILASSRYPLALARQDQLPEVFTRIHDRFSTPSVAVLSTGVLLVGCILFLPVIQLAKLASTFKLLVLAFFNLALIILRESDIEWYKPEFRSPLYPYVQIVGILASVSLIAFLGWLPLLTSLGLILAGVVWYYVYVRERVSRTGALFRQPVEEKEREIFRQARSRRYSGKESVIVPFFGLENVDMLHAERQIRLGAALCDRDERLDVVDFVEVPEQAFLSDYTEGSDQFEVLEERVHLLKNEIESEIHLDQVITHSSRGALRNYAERELPHWIVLDWEEPSPWQFLIGGQKWWLEDFPCDVLLFEDRDRPGFEEIVVMTEPGPYDGEVVYAADHIAAAFGGRITFVNPYDPDVRDEEFIRTYQRELEDLSRTPSRSRMISSSDWLEKVVELSVETDLLILGDLTDQSFSWNRQESPGTVLARRVESSVARVHSSLRSPRTVMRMREDGDVRLMDYLDERNVFTGLTSVDKDELFRDIARCMADDEVPAEQLEEALWDREEIQSTHIERGVAMPHGIVDDLAETRVAVFVTAEPIPYTEAGDDVQICVVTIGPPSDRQTHLRIIGEMAELFVRYEVRDRMLRAPDDASVLSLIEEQVD